MRGCEGVLSDLYAILKECGYKKAQQNTLPGFQESDIESNFAYANRSRTGFPLCATVKGRLLGL